MNSITRDLNIFAILTENKDQKQIFCQQNYIFSLHMQDVVACVSQIYSFLTKNLFLIFVFNQDCNYVLTSGDTIHH